LSILDEDKHYVLLLFKDFFLEKALAIKKVYYNLSNKIPIQWILSIMLTFKLVFYNINIELTVEANSARYLVTH